MARTPYRQRCEAYFDNPDNRPFSILEACDAMGIDYQTLREWEGGEDKALRTLARRVKQRVAAGWEKGEVAASMAIHLMKNYLDPGDGAEAPSGPLEIVLRVETGGD